MNQILAALLAGAGALRRIDHPEHIHRIDAALARGELVAPFRGVYTTPDANHVSRLRALCLADPDAVATGASAEFLHGWTPNPRRASRPRPGCGPGRGTRWSGARSRSG